MKICYILVGVPASGKSTWVKETFGDQCVVISSDDIIEELSADRGMTYNEGWAKFVRIAEKCMWEEFEVALDSDSELPIVIDRTNLKIASRRKFIQMAQRAGYKIEFKVFDIPAEEEWNRRLNSRPGKNIPIGTLNNMMNGYEAPTDAELHTNSYLVIDHNPAVI